MKKERKGRILGRKTNFIARSTKMRSASLN